MNDAKETTIAWLEQAHENFQEYLAQGDTSMAVCVAEDVRTAGFPKEAIQLLEQIDTYQLELDYTV